MRKMRKIIGLIIVLAMTAALLAGCGQTPDDIGGSDTAPPDNSASQPENKAPETDDDGTGEGQEDSNTEGPADAETPVVYMTTDISADGLMEIYEALGASPEGKIAVKLSTGEPGSNYLRTDLIGELVQSLDATIVECNTAYGGSRSNTAMHYQVAEDHGYTDIANVDIIQLFHRPEPCGSDEVCRKGGSHCGHPQRRGGGDPLGR